jgi:fructokinase
VVIDGQVWPGLQHIAGEWGHHTLEPDGPLCYCGRRGCAEAVLCGPAFERQYVDAGGDALPAQEIGQRADAGETIAAAVVRHYVERFGRALGNVINILDPSIVVLGGGLSNLDALLTLGPAAVARHVFNDELRTPIVRHALGDSAGVIGAALLD